MKIIPAQFIQTMIFSQKKRDYACAALTALFFITAFCIGVLIPVKNRNYKEIRIQLTQDEPRRIEKPVVEPVEKAVISPKPAPVKKSSTQKSSSKVQAKVKSSPSKTSTPVKNQVYQKSMEELMAENASKSSQKSRTYDDDSFDQMFDDDAYSSSSTTTNANYGAKRQDSFSGTAGTVQTSSSSSSSSVAPGSSGSPSGGVSQQTSSRLQSIANATYSAHGSTSGVEYQTDNVSTSRMLLYPANPVISFPPEIEELVERTIKVYISFKINSTGFVIYDTIGISQAQNLHEKVVAEIKRQISTWRFDSGSGDANVGFYYTIKIEN